MRNVTQQNFLSDCRQNNQAKTLHESRNPHPAHQKREPACVHSNLATALMSSDFVKLPLSSILLDSQVVFLFCWIRLCANFSCLLSYWIRKWCFYFAGFVSALADFCIPVCKQSQWTLTVKEKHTDPPE
eukprot:5042307-Amphidinium_carterae.1